MKGTLFVVLALVALLFASLASAEMPPEFILKWGSYGSGNGQFNLPSGVACDSQGNVYVADTYNHRIQKFTADGVFLTKWGTYGTGDGQFNEPRSPAVDADGNVFVSDRGNHRIQKFTGDGVFLTKWGSYGSGDGQFDQPNGVALDDVGNLYVASGWGANDRIQKFTGDGVFLTKWGNYGSGDGQFNNPAGVAVDLDGNVYVADFRNYRIQKFTGDGVFLAKWGSYGSGDGKFDRPHEVDADASGNVYVTDYYNNRIQIFRGDGLFITKWGSGGSGDGQFHYPYDVVVDVRGNIYVADFGNHRIQRFRRVNTPVGTHVVVVPPDSATGSTPVTITFDEVTAAGYTSLNVFDNGPPPEHGFSLCGKYYDVRTTAVYTGLVEVCIDYSETKCNKPVLKHYVGTHWDLVPSYPGQGEKIICGTVSSLSLFALFEPIPIAFDIQPGSCPNPFNITWLENMPEGTGNENALPKKGGVMPAAIVGNEAFDVTEIDVSTLLLNGVAPLRTNIEDVTRPPTGEGECDCTTEGPDGFPDLTLKFSRQEVAGVLGDVEHGDVVILTISGLLNDGSAFEASDCVEIISKNPQPHEFAGSDETRLGPVTPNPFNPTTTIGYSVPASGMVSLRVYDVSGRLVRVLVDEEKPAGGHAVMWDGLDSEGAAVSSGVYFVRLESGGQVQTRRIALIK